MAIRVFSNLMKKSIELLLAGITGGILVYITTIYIKSQKDNEDSTPENDTHSHCKQKIHAERMGRINAEKALRSDMVNKISDPSIGYPLLVIGNAQSPYKSRRGTPRQGLLVPASRTIIQLSNEIPTDCLLGLDTYSHLFVQFIFHDNTNLVKSLLVNSKGDNETLNHRTSASKSSTFTKRVQSFASKVLPPLLNGGSLGVFATRAPHRPNALGLSLVKIESVDVEKRMIVVTGADLVNGTPIVDIKPWGPFDCPTCIHNTVDHNGIISCNSSTSRCESFKVQVPDWVFAGLRNPYQLPVAWTQIANDQLSLLVRDGSCSFYDKAEDLQETIEQMLSLDIRSVHRGRGQGPVSNNLSTDLIGDIGRAQMNGYSQEYEVDFDNFNIKFSIKKGDHDVHGDKPWILIENVVLQ